MFGKHFASMYTGSMFGQPALVHAVMGYVIANQRPSRKDGVSSVELNPMLLAPMFATSLEDVVSAITVLTSPDPKSRTDAEEGRRLVLETGVIDGPATYRVVNGPKYRGIRDEDERREQVRVAVAKHREKKAGNQSKPRKPKKAQVEEEEEAEEEADPERARAQEPPPPSEASAPEPDPGSGSEPEPGGVEDPEDPALDPPPEVATERHARAVSLSWARCATTAGHHGMHGFEQWRADWNLIAIALVQAVGREGGDFDDARAALCWWFWCGPDGPFKSGRLTHRGCNPAALAKRIGEDLEAAGAWWHGLEASEQATIVATANRENVAPSEART